MKIQREDYWMADIATRLAGNAEPTDEHFRLAFRTLERARLMYADCSKERLHRGLIPLAAILHENSLRADGLPSLLGAIRNIDGLKKAILREFTKPVGNVRDGEVIVGSQYMLPSEIRSFAFVNQNRKRRKMMTDSEWNRSIIRATTIPVWIESSPANP